MDLETENRIAAILMKEAVELRRQAEKEGVHVYLQQPKPRVRPNPRFLAATVLGVQQANRAVEMNEMWRVREKERELDDRLTHKSKDQRIDGMVYREGNSRESSSKRQADDSAKASCSPSNGGGLRDEELEEFLHSRAKRGRGAVGSRMDETGPYLPRSPDSKEDLRNPDVLVRRISYGPERPSSSSLKSYESSEEESSKKRKKVHCKSSKKKECSKKQRSKDRSNDKRRKRKEEKRSKHRK